MEKSYIKDGEIKKRSQIVLKKNGYRIVNPKESQLLEEGWTEYNDTQGPYKALVESYIRQRYSLSDELGIIRQKDAKPDEYATYYAYCEDCKTRAKNKLGITIE